LRFFSALIFISLSFAGIQIASNNN
jgi:hypothetical protein